MQEKEKDQREARPRSALQEEQAGTFQPQGEAAHRPSEDKLLVEQPRADLLQGECWAPHPQVLQPGPRMNH